MCTKWQRGIIQQVHAKQFSHKIVWLKPRTGVRQRQAAVARNTQKCQESGGQGAASGCLAPDMPWNRLLCSLAPGCRNLCQGPGSSHVLMTGCPPAAGCLPESPILFCHIVDLIVTLHVSKIGFKSGSYIADVYVVDITKRYNLFIYQAREFQPAPSWVLDSPVSYRNWTVRNPAGTRLDSSSLVNR